MLSHFVGSNAQIEDLRAAPEGVADRLEPCVRAPLCRSLSVSQRFLYLLATLHILCRIVFLTKCTRITRHTEAVWPARCPKACSPKI